MAGLLGPSASVSDSMWRLIEAEVLKVGWRITKDLFATASNARVKKFCSRCYEPSAEHIDACQCRTGCLLCALLAMVVTGNLCTLPVQDGACIVLLVRLAVTLPQ